MSQFFDKVRKLNDQSTVLIPLPGFLLKGIGLIGDVFRRFGFRTSVSSFNTGILCINNYYDPSKPRKDFDLELRSTDEAITEALSWFNRD